MGYLINVLLTHLTYYICGVLVEYDKEHVSCDTVFSV